MTLFCECSSVEAIYEKRVRRDHARVDGDGLAFGVGEELIMVEVVARHQV
jgi:acid stress-induced BolA-like protein IbaG/YrbA